MTTPPTEPGEDTLADQQRYLAAAHAMQTGVAYELELDPSQGTPKHLRVGVNSAMVAHSVLTRLLIAKGLITWSEYYAALADATEAERDLYAARLSEHYGSTITLA